MNKICEATLKLREVQSIHDFCLTSDFVIIFEGSLRFHLKDLLWGNKFFFNCLSFDEKLPTLIHIYSK
jgi:carotenoid cleavage dioxygenase-like enzyme